MVSDGWIIQGFQGGLEFERDGKELAAAIDDVVGAVPSWAIAPELGGFDSDHLERPRPPPASSLIIAPTNAHKKWTVCLGTGGQFHSERVDDLVGIHTPPKDLRNTLPTEAEKGGWMSIWVRRYFGHAPANMIERSYLAEVEGDWRKESEVDSFVEKLREKVVVHIDAEVKKSKKMHSVDLRKVVSI